MVNRIQNDVGCYCEKAQYTEDQFICMITGEPCIFGDNPNQYECYSVYSKYKRSEKHAKR